MMLILRHGLLCHNAGISVIAVRLSRLLCAIPMGLIRECENRFKLVEIGGWTTSAKNATKCENTLLLQRHLH